MLTFAAIRDRILTQRPQKMERELQLCFQIAARRFAERTYLLQEDVVFTVASGARVASVYAAADEKECVWIIKAERVDGVGSTTPLEPLNARLLRDGTLRIQHETGTLYGFVSKDGAFVPYQPVQVDTQVHALVAYKPVGDFYEVDLPNLVEDAIVDGTLAEAFRLPGDGYNIQLAMHHESEFMKGVADHRLIELVGDTEYSRYRHRPQGLGNGWGKLKW